MFVCPVLVVPDSVSSPGQEHILTQGLQSGSLMTHKVPLYKLTSITSRCSLRRDSR